MIRKSIGIGIAALVVSLLFHMVGLLATSRLASAPPPPPARSEVVAMGNTFEDLASAVIDPVQPEEPPQEPKEEPTTDTPPVPELPEVPTTEVLVASENPQDTYAPDTGNSDVLQPTIPEGAQDNGVAGDAEEITALEGPEPTSAAQPTPELQAPVGTPDETRDEAPSESAPITPTLETAPAPEAPEELAALPDPTVPLVPVTPQETTEADQDPETPSQTTQDTPAPEEDENLPAEPPTAAEQGLPEGFEAFDDLSFPQQEDESPLDIYKRDRDERIASGGFGIQPGSNLGGRGPGNSDETNYAGRVLVHLNRTAPVYVSARGFARVFFEINPDGSLAWVDVTDSSGSEEINRAAKIQIQNAAPFPRPPGGKSRRISFFYQIR